MEKKELFLPDLFTLLDSLEWGISIFDENGNFLWVNRYVLKCSGRPRRFYEGKSVYDFQSMGILDVPVCSQVFQQKKAVTHLQNSYSENGKLEEYIVTATPIFDGNGNIKFVVADRMRVRQLKEYNNLAEQERKQGVSTRMKVTSAKRELIYKSEGMKRIVEDAERAASVASVILLQGESGTGKDVLAHFIHENSDYKHGSMIEINCASMPESLLE